jgi:hypothetical protein
MRESSQHNNSGDGIGVPDVACLRNSCRFNEWAPILLAAVFILCGGCATVRVTDSVHTATEQFLMSEAARQAIDQLATDSLRDRKVYLDTSYITADQNPPYQILFAIGEMRAKLLTDGARLVSERTDAQIIVEMRAGAIGIDRTEFLLGIPATAIPFASSGNADVTTPELAVFKTTKQQGYAALSIVAFWANSGDIVARSGPYVGRTLREDYWIFGTGPHTVGNIPTAGK